MGEEFGLIVVLRNDPNVCTEMTKVEQNLMQQKNLITCHSKVDHVVALFTTLNRKSLVSILLTRGQETEVVMLLLSFF